MVIVIDYLHLATPKNRPHSPQSPLSPLANQEMARILEELMSETPGVRVAAVHRAGELKIGDTAVIVAASAPHRAEAFEVCRKAIGRIKDTVPVWKKEWAPDGSALWVNL